ncbi:MAG: DUF2029 domain-containing protein [Dehalococcoidia bacterium]|nr:MAG: DUF2029 domain-containing protein [Dehalococcoidia bacterium]
MYYDRVHRVLIWLEQRPFIFFVILHAIVFLAVFASLDYLVGGNSFERSFALKILDGMVPYTDFASEYPPLALFAFLVPALFSSTQPLYDVFFAVEIYLLDLVVLFILTKFTSHLKLKVWTVLGIYTLCLLAVGSIVTGRFDLLPAALVLIALYAFVSGRNKIAWGFLALGATAKLYPLIIAPLFFLYLVRQRQYKRLIQGIAFFAGVVIALNLPWIIINWDGYFNLSNDTSFLGYHVARGLHSESIYGSVILTGQLIGLTKVDAGMQYGSWDITSPAADAMANYSFYITVALLALLYFMYMKMLLKRPRNMNKKWVLDKEAVQSMLRYSILAVLIMLLTSKVFSPQFLIWLCPLIPIVRTRWPRISAFLFLIAGAITQYIYPHNYIEFELFTPYLVVLHATRNWLLLVMALIYILPLGDASLKVEKSNS